MPARLRIELEALDFSVDGASPSLFNEYTLRRGARVTSESFMPELRTYRRHEIPTELAWQIRSFVRVQWPFLDTPEHPLWNDRPSPDDSPLHFLVAEGDLLLSHVCVNRRTLEQRDESFDVYGLSTVFTFPAYRKAGHALRAVRAASDYIRTSQADLAMLFCGQPLRKFYASAGWSAADKARILFGDKLRPQLKNDNLVMMMFLSEKGRAARNSFEKQDVYVGSSTW